MLGLSIRTERFAFNSPGRNSGMREQERGKLISGGSDQLYRRFWTVSRRRVGAGNTKGTVATRHPISRLVRGNPSPRFLGLLICLEPFRRA